MLGGLARAFLAALAALANADRLGDAIRENPSGADAPFDYAPAAPCAGLKPRAACKLRDGHQSFVRVAVRDVGPRPQAVHAHDAGGPGRVAVQRRDVGWRVEGRSGQHRKWTRARAASLTLRAARRCGPASRERLIDAGEALIRASGRRAARRRRADPFHENGYRHEVALPPGRGPRLRLRALPQVLEPRTD